MKLTKKEICCLVQTGRIPRMPGGTFVAGFDDSDGYYPIEELTPDYAGCECEIYTYLTIALGGIECYLRFI